MLHAIVLSIKFTHVICCVEQKLHVHYLRLLSYLPLNILCIINNYVVHGSQESLSQQDQLDQTAAYIKELKERIDELKLKKEILALMNNDDNIPMSSPISASFRVRPVVELREIGSSTIEVLVVSGLDKNFRLCDVMSVLQEEGADVVGANISSVGDRVFHTLHAQVDI